MKSSHSRRLRGMINTPDEDVSLLEAALVIASAQYPSLDFDHYYQRIDEWAGALRSRLSDEASAEDRLRTLNSFLFVEQGFSGNMDDYYDPRNSYINEVLDRKTGIPITLSVLYMELGQRIGLPLEGVSFPGHFLVKLPVQGGAVVLDPFNGGISLDEDDLSQLLAQVLGDEYYEVTRLLNAASKQDILVRMLRNLKAIHQKAEDQEQALEVVNMILAIDPALSEEYRDRGLLLQQLECDNAAIRDFNHYLTAHPDADDADAIRTLMIELQQTATRLH